MKTKAILNKTVVFTVISVACIFNRAQSQAISDLRGRINAGILWEPTKKLDVVGRYRLTTFQNATVFMRSMFSLNATYRILKDWDAGMEYRYNTTYGGDYHRFFVFTKVKYGIGPFDFSYRLRYQQDQDRFNNEYLQQFPAEKVFRNRVMIKFAYNRKTDFYTYAEHFSVLENRELSSYRIRYGLGIQYMFKRRHEFSLEYFINDEFNQKHPEDIAAINVAYIYHLKKEKKKNKHKIISPTSE